MEATSREEDTLDGGKGDKTFTEGGTVVGDVSEGPSQPSLEQGMVSMALKR